MTTQTLVRKFEVSDQVRELTSILRVLGELRPSPIQIVKILRGFASATAALDFDFLPAVRAGEHRVVTKLSGCGLKLLFALRALQVPGHLIDEIGHGNSPSVESGNPTVAESPSDRKAGGAEASVSTETGGMTRRVDLRGLNSPYLVRANLRARDSIVAQMADDLRIVVTRRGWVDTEDLELLGWTPAQINNCGADARRRALALDLRRTA